jgi:hypothetical protein
MSIRAVPLRIIAVLAVAIAVVACGGSSEPPAALVRHQSSSRNRCPPR